MFHAISDPTRRQLLDALARVEELPLHEMTAQVPMGRTGVAKHLTVLKEAGLVEDRRVGRESRYRLNAARLREVQEWVAYYERFWTPQLDRLKQWLEEAPMHETVSLAYEINRPIHRVWQALTDPAMLSQWMFFETSDFQATVGHTFQFRSKMEQWTGVIDCEVLAVEAPHRLSYSWATEGWQGGRHHTVVTWTLTESKPGITQLQLEQSGFDPAATQEIGGARYGWSHQLNQLQTLLGTAENP